MSKIQSQIHKKKLLIIAVSGIGNVILQSPTIDSILISWKYDVDILFGNQAMADVYADTTIIREKIILSEYPRIIEKIKLLWKLIRKKYDFSIALFPSHRIKFHILPILAGIQHRYSHRYNWWFFTRGTFLSNHTILADPSIHDIDQNLDLLTLIWIKKPSQIQLHFAQSEDNKKKAREFMSNFSLDKKRLIGIHPGSGDLEWKRWWDTKYLALIKELAKKGFQIVLCWNWKELINFVLKENIIIFQGTINETWALISQCRFFISWDTGLMHIAATQKIPQVAIWNWTNLNRTRPYNKNVKIVETTNKYQYNYPFI